MFSEFNHVNKITPTVCCINCSAVQFRIRSAFSANKVAMSVPDETPNCTSTRHLNLGEKKKRNKE